MKKKKTQASSSHDVFFASFSAEYHFFRRKKTLSERDSLNSGSESCSSSGVFS